MMSLVSCLPSFFRGRRAGRSPRGAPPLSEHRDGTDGHGDQEQDSAEQEHHTEEEGRHDGVPALPSAQQPDTGESAREGDRCEQRGRGADQLVKRDDTADDGDGDQEAAGGEERASCALS
ncbi:hypothetical protein [Promicromonospora iranensis]|uniref:Uncharacterized protein n=1 Tax=Promicromonospora iranensis TaxID=1105144 RepID=A0ABU2CJB9_9MICO|nr:hypothetical protein [Promicromonospora iranensis]MDR7381426.1 hypothetical protein [Promicromonospora iranensis]